MKKRSRNIDWSLVDLTRPAADLASELGVHVNAIYAARKRLGIEAENLAGGHREGAGARIGNQNRKGTGSNLGNLNIRIPTALLDDVREEANRRKLTASEFVRLALIAYMKCEQKEEYAQTTLDQ